MNEPLLLKVGKALDNDVVLNIPFISDYHLEVFKDVEGNVFMTDLNSLNGTFVNGRKLVGFVMLKPRDEVFLGSGFRFQWEQLVNQPKQEKNNNKERRVYEDAYSSVNSVENKKESTTVTTKPVNENRDLVIIYGMIFVIILFWVLFS